LFWLLQNDFNYLAFPNSCTKNSGAAEFVTFDNLLRESDFVIACCSMKEENKGIFNNPGVRSPK
jgi:lactate dehydrogenase-like 2-hydroxyacid dehydrogenase